MFGAYYIPWKSLGYRFIVLRRYDNSLSLVCNRRLRNGRYVVSTRRFHEPLNSIDNTWSIWKLIFVVLWLGYRPWNEKKWLKSTYVSQNDTCVIMKYKFHWNHSLHVFFLIYLKLLGRNGNEQFWNVYMSHCFYHHCINIFEVSRFFNCDWIRTKSMAFVFYIFFINFFFTNKIA